MPDLIPAAPWLAQVDRIITDLLSELIDYETDTDDWDGWVEMSMNDAWDLLRKVDPHA